ncbi:hypothetical protein ACIPVK_15765 [Paeniglutamicibacter sp. MACA_103]|uniref:hypothetical protein n=1 Tax=Paeniglutamicibacter sp. MACA_103 TaxID=3377337 RepID=UPI003893106F
MPENNPHARPHAKVEDDKGRQAAHVDEGGGTRRLWAARSDAERPAGQQHKVLPSPAADAAATYATPGKAPRFAAFSHTFNITDAKTLDTSTNGGLSCYLKLQ